MVEYDPLSYQLNSLESDLEEVKSSLDLENKTKRKEELEREMEEPNFWDDMDKAREKTQELNSIKSDLETVKELESKYDDMAILIEMGNEEEDLSLVPEITDGLKELSEKIDSIRIRTLLSDEYDECSAILTLHAGAGGTEACDWTSMLYRMYTRWADAHGFSVEELDYLEGDEAGIKNVTFQVNGENAYGLLKSEHGVHRLVRISPFNANGKRQTSFSSCDVMPVLEKDVDVEINDDDIRIDTYRSSGAGGQHINKTSSAIRITHLPTGIVVQCQNERSQHQNKHKAMQMLKAKLLMLQMEADRQKQEGIRGEVMDNSFGSQIRSYVLQPYTMVKDTRTGYETSNASGVLDGDLDPFINAYLKWNAGL